MMADPTPEPMETPSEFYARKSMLALESIALALGTLVAFALPTLESIDEKLPRLRPHLEKFPSLKPDSIRAVGV